MKYKIVKRPDKGLKLYLIIDQFHIHVFRVSYIFVRRPTLTQLQTKG